MNRSQKGAGHPDSGHRLRIGIDLGGTKIEGLALGPDGLALARRRIAAPRGDYRATLGAIAALVAELEAESGGTAHVGIGMPGSISPLTHLVQNSNSTWLNGRPLDRDLEAELSRPLRFANDANCFALSEATDGAGAGARTVFGIILGTGCGGGIVINGCLVNGPRGVGGEWGHNPLPWSTAEEHPGPPCWCGRLGCMEIWVSGTGVENDHERATGVKIPAEDIAELAASGDPAARATLARHVSRLGRGIAHIVNIVDPDVIVLGGGFSKQRHLYTALPAVISKHTFCDAGTADVRPAKWGDASGVRGAAWLWNDT